MRKFRSVGGLLVYGIQVVSILATLPMGNVMLVLYGLPAMPIWWAIVMFAVIAVFLLLRVVRVALVINTQTQSVTVRNLWKTTHFEGGLTVAGITYRASLFSGVIAENLPLLTIREKLTKRGGRVDATAFMRHSKRIEMLEMLKSVGVDVDEFLNEEITWSTKP